MDLFQWLTDTTEGKCLFTTLVSMIPIIELRGGIPFGVALGLLRCPVVIVDLGLDREGLAVAQRLALRWPVVDLYRPEDGAEAH